MFKKGYGDWKQYRRLPRAIEIDFHYSENSSDKSYGLPISYDEKMDQVRCNALEALRTTYEQDRPYVIYRHGASTSRNGKATARSVVRELMRSSKATPYIIRRDCIQHETVFVAAIRPNPSVRSDLPQ